MRHRPAEHEFDRAGPLDDVDRPAREVISLARRRRAAHEEYQTPFGRKPEVATCLGLWNEPEALEVEAGGNHMGLRLAVQEVLQVRRDDDRRIGLPGHGT